ncbi:MAG: hypothetical protein GX230_11585 [Lentisphaerae bacterium]|jgi:hypothetical protein|nr:hypothetical protein [Lentisphaerota bacterium]
MTFAEVVAAIGGKMVVLTETADRKVRHVVGSDLMSDVLLVDEDDMMLLTSLASDQVLRTAQIVGATGVVIVNDKPVPDSMADVARELGLSLATSNLSKYEGCVAVYKALNGITT